MNKTWFIKNRVDDDTFIQICKESKSMAKAVASLGLHFNSFKRRAIKLGCYQPNQAGIGIRKNMPKILLTDIIIKGIHPQYQSYKLKIRLIEEGLKVNQCEVCQIKDWNNKKLNMELHHIDGDKTNHLIDNLLILCPNCHSQTDTFRSKNRKI